MTPEDADDITVSISGMTISGIVGGVPNGGDGVGFASLAPELVGLTFSDVWFSDQRAVAGSAAFVQNYSGPVLFENSGVINNISSTVGAGGAVALLGGSGDATFSSTRIDQNTVEGGGAGVAAVSLDGALRFVDSDAFGNTAGGVGGAVHAIEISGGVEVVNTTFNDNTAAIAGGALAVTDSAITLTDSTFEFNTASASVGGAIYTLNAIEAVNVDGTLFDGNTAASEGGAMYLAGLEDDVTVTDTEFIDNEAGANGGAIYVPAVAPAGSVSFFGAEFTGNSAQGGTGGGIFIGESNGRVWVEASTFSNNVALFGAGIAMAENNNELLIVNSTFNENLGDSAISQGVLDGVLTVALSTIVANTAVNIGANDGDALVTNSILDTTGDPVVVDSADFPIDAEWTLFSQAIDPNYVTDLGGNLQNTDPQLGALADNGGPTLTMLPAASSPAINRGDPELSLEVLFGFDQRGEGFPRIENSRVDMGAVEVFVEPVLPATGASVNVVIPIGGGLLLLAGIAAVVFVRPRKN